MLSQSIAYQLYSTAFLARTPHNLPLTSPSHCTDMALMAVSPDRFLTLGLLFILNLATRASAGSCIMHHHSIMTLGNLTVLHVQPHRH